MTGDVTAVVVTWNSAADIEACLEALFRSDTRGALRVVVVDNASSDSTPALLQRWSSRATVVLSPTNDGYAQGNNRAARDSDDDYLLLLNPDCVVDPDTLERLRQHLEGRPRCAVASALLLEPDGSPQYFARREPTLRRSIPWFLHAADRRDRRRGGRARASREYRELLADPPGEAFPVDIPAAACALVRRSVLPTPLFDPQFPLFFNDVDLYRRLREQGHAVEVVPSARALHGHGRSHRQLAIDRKRAEQVLSLRRYARRWWPRWQQVVLDGLLLVDAALCRRWARQDGPEQERLAALYRGTRGALGLEGGAEPFLSPRPRPWGTTPA